MSVDSVAFRKTMSRFASGVTVVTARDAAGDPVGLTVSAFASLSLDPPMVLICLNKGCHDLAAFQTGPFVVNVLADDQESLSRRFAGPREARFVDLESDTAENGCPTFAGCLAVIECRTDQVVEGGDHDIVIGTVTALGAREDGLPLLYFGGRYRYLADDGRATT